MGWVQAVFMTEVLYMSSEWAAFDPTLFSPLTLPTSWQEAAAIIAQRPENPREFFRQQERVASASSETPPPFNRTGRGAPTFMCWGGRRCVCSHGGVGVEQWLYEVVGNI